MMNFAKTAAMALICAIPTHAYAFEETRQVAVFEPFSLEGPDGQLVDAERGQITVLENRQAAESRAIALNFVRLAATTDDPGYPVVYLAGGPGSSPVAQSRGPRFAFFNRLREVGDVILLEQRGVGLSSTFASCPAEFTSEGPLNGDAFERAYLENIERCIGFWQSEGVDISGYNTRENARDIEDLRAALGVERLNLVGLSYGTHLGMAAIKQEVPISRIVFTGLEGPDQTIKLPADIDAFVARVDAAIGTDPAARAAYPDLVAMMRRVHDRLDTDPPVLDIELGDGQTLQLSLDSSLVRIVASFFLTSDPDRIAQLPVLYAQLDAGSYAAWTRMLQLAFRSELRSLSGMSQLMDIASGASDQQLARWREQAPDSIFRDAVNFPMPSALTVAPELVLDDAFRSDFSTPIETLLLMSTMDGRTPIESQMRIAPMFSNSVSVIVENGGHNVFEQSEEVQARIVEFLRTGATSTDPIILPPVEFVVP